MGIKKMVLMSALSLCLIGYNLSSSTVISTSRALSKVLPENMVWGVTTYVLDLSGESRFSDEPGFGSYPYLRDLMFPDPVNITKDDINPILAKHIIKNYSFEDANIFQMQQFIHILDEADLQWYWNRVLYMRTGGQSFPHFNYEDSTESIRKRFVIRESKLPIYHDLDLTEANELMRAYFHYNTECIIGEHNVARRIFQVVNTSSLMRSDLEEMAEIIDKNCPELQEYRDAALKIIGTT